MGFQKIRGPYWRALQLKKSYHILVTSWNPHGEQQMDHGNWRLAISLGHSPSQ